MNELDLMFEFADNLKYYMDRQGMNQSDLARASHISQPIISAYLNARKMPTMKSIVNICCALKCDFVDLLPFITSPVE